MDFILKTGMMQVHSRLTHITDLVQMVQQLQDPWHPRGVGEERVVLHLEGLQELLGSHPQLEAVHHYLGDNT